MTVTRSSDKITVTGTQSGDNVSAREEGGQYVITSELGINSADCTQLNDQQVSCQPSPALVFLGKDGSDVFVANLPVATRQIGGSGRDALKGGSANDVLKGQSDKDVLKGREGADHLVGGDGVDDCSGGTGNDSVEGCE